MIRSYETRHQPEINEQCPKLVEMRGGIEVMQLFVYLIIQVFRNVM